MYNYTGSPSVNNCVFKGNYASGSGGGICNKNGSSPNITNCIFIGNSAGYGGGVLNHENYCNPVFVNCMFSGNYALTQGGAFYSGDHSNATVTNCTFSGNHCVGNGGAFYIGSNSPTAIKNSIIWGNTAGTNPQIGGNSPTITYTCLENGGTSNGNINTSPNFVRDPDPGQNGWDGIDDDYGDLRLSTGSPCIDSGDNEADIDAQQTGIQPLPNVDIVGNPRKIDDPYTDPDTGNGQPPIVDMGAYEYFVDCNANGIYDLLEGDDSDGDGLIDECDLCRWPDDPDYVFADIDHDTDVDQDDFAAFQLCYTDSTPAEFDKLKCGCFDREEDEDVDADDWIAFEALASGPGIPASGGGEGGGRGGEGEEGGEMLASAGQESYEPSVPAESYEPYVMAWFVDSQTGLSDIKLPAGGGTVSLNLVLDSEVPVAGFEGVISVSTAGDDDTRDDAGGGDSASDGCLVGSLSVTYFTSGYMPNADAKLTVCDIRIPGSDQQAEINDDAQDAPNPPFAKGESITLSTGDFSFDAGLNALSILEGPEEWVLSVAIDPATIDLPAEANCDDIWAQMFSNKPELYLDALDAGQTVVATISLQFTAQGTYNVSFTEGMVTAATGQQATITPGPTVEITIPAD